MHVHVSLSSTFDIKISGWTKAIKSTEMNVETFQFYYFTSILSCQRKKGRNNNIGYAYFKGTISLVQTHSRCFTDSQFGCQKFIRLSAAKS